MQMTVVDALLKGVERHKAGDIQEADKLYTAILRVQPNHPDANHNMGVLAVGVGKLVLAQSFFKKALEADPAIEQFWLSHIQNLKSLDRTKEAIDALETALAYGFGSDSLRLLEGELGLSEPKSVKANLNNQNETPEPSAEAIHEIFELYSEGKYQDVVGAASTLIVEFSFSEVLRNVLGAAFVGLKNYNSALEQYRKALEINSNNPITYYNMGVVMQEVGQLETAIEHYEKAILLNPEYSEARNNLGVIFRIKGLLDASIEQCRKAIDANPSFADAYNNMGISLYDKGDNNSALEFYNKAINLRPGYIDAYFNMGLALRAVHFDSYNPEFSVRIVELLAHKTLVEPSEIMTPIVSLLKRDPIVRQALQVDLAGQSGKSLHHVLAELSKVSLLMALLRVSPVPDLEIEALLTSLRAAILLEVSNSKTLNEFQPFILTLALQCYTTEYIYCCSEEEAQALALLEESTLSQLASGLQPNSISLLCLASYKALHEYPWSTVLNIPLELEELARVQLLEPAQERKLRAQIPTLQKITHENSLEVQNQYEENPYPRWLYSRLIRKSVSISEVARFLDLKIVNEGSLATENPQILVAGCGTGQNSIGVAARFANCDVLAVDLSLNSLSYAKRKSEEFGFNNINYMQADILCLANLGKEFDLIECSGVLHHMEDPMEGWEVLVQLLKPGGLMKISLYSELGRKHIVEIRNAITEAGIGVTVEEMKQFRVGCMRSDSDAHSRLAQTTDFYSLSAFRDLIFHVQEHRFTIPQIGTCLAELGLEFCGFELSNTEAMRKFRIENPGPNDIHCLDKWNTFEERNPIVFSEMYQFWCQKAHRP